MVKSLAVIHPINGLQYVPPKPFFNIYFGVKFGLKLSIIIHIGSAMMHTYMIILPYIDIKQVMIRSTTNNSVRKTCMFTLMNKSKKETLSMNKMNLFSSVCHEEHLFIKQNLHELSLWDSTCTQSPTQ